MCSAEFPRTGQRHPRWDKSVPGLCGLGLVSTESKPNSARRGCVSLSKLLSLFVSRSSQICKRAQTTNQRDVKTEPVDTHKAFSTAPADSKLSAVSSDCPQQHSGSDILRFRAVLDTGLLA